jgi:hypothetical protein
MIDLPTAAEYLEAQKSTASEKWMQGFDACRQLAIELGALDELAQESQQLDLYRDNSVLVPCDKLKEMQEQIAAHGASTANIIQLGVELEKQNKALREHLSLLQDRARA